MRNAATSPSRNLLEESRARFKPGQKPIQQLQQQQQQQLADRNNYQPSRPSLSQERSAQHPLLKTLKIDTQSQSSIAKRLLDHQQRMLLLSPGRNNANSAAGVTSLKLSESNNNNNHNSTSSSNRNRGKMINAKIKQNDHHDDDSDDTSKEFTEVFNPFSNSNGAAATQLLRSSGSTAKLSQSQSSQQLSSGSSGDIVRKKIQYFTASAKNFILSSNKLKRFLESSRSSDIQYAVNLFEIDRDNMEKSLRHLEQECEYLSSFQSNHSSNNPEGVYAKLVDQLREENSLLKMRTQDRFSAEMVELQSMCERLQHQLEKSVRKCSERKNCIKKLYDLVEDKEREVEDLNAQIEQYAEEIKAKQMRIHSLEDDLQLLERDNSDLQTQRQEKRDCIDELRQSIMEVQARLKIVSRDDVQDNNRPSLMARWKTVRDFLLDRHKIGNLQREESEMECVRLREELHAQVNISRDLECRITELMGLLKATEEQKQEFEETVFQKTQLETRLEESNSHSTNMVRKLQQEARRWQEEVGVLKRSTQEQVQHFEAEKSEIAAAFDRKLHEIQSQWEHRLQQCSEEWTNETQAKDTLVLSKQKEVEALSKQLSLLERKRGEMGQTLENERTLQVKAIEEQIEVVGDQKRRIYSLSEELNAVRNQLKTLQSELADRSDELAAKKNEVALLSSDLMQQKETMLTVKHRLNAVIDENSVLKREVSAAQERVKISDYKAESLSREVNKISEELQSVAQIKVELSLQLESQASAAKKSIDKLRLQVNELAVEAKSKESQLAAAVKDAAEATEQVQSLKVEIVRVVHRQQTTENELASSEARVKELIIEVDDSKRSLSGVKAEKSQGEEQSKKRVAGLSEEIKKLAGQLGKLENMIAEEKSANEEATRSIGRLEEQLIEKEKALMQAEAKTSREIAWRDARIEEANKLSHRMEVDLLNASVTAEKWKKDVIVLESRVNSLSAINGEMENLLAERQLQQQQQQQGEFGVTSVDMIGEQRKRLEIASVLAIREDEIAQLRQAIAEVEAEKERSLRIAEEKSRNVDFLQRSLEEAQLKSCEVDELVEKLREELAEVTGKQRKAESGLANAKSENKRQSSQLEQVNELLVELQEESRQLKDINEQLCERNSSLTRDVDRFTDQLGQFSSQNVKYDSIIARLNEEKESLEDQLMKLKNDRVEIDHRLAVAVNSSEKNAEKLVHACKELDALKLAKIDLDEMLVESQNRFNAVEQEKALRVAQLTAETERSQKALKTLREENGMLRKQIDGIFEQSETQRGAQSEQYASEVGQLNEVVLELKKQLKKVQDERGELAVRVEASEKRNEGVTNERDALVVEAAKLRELKQKASESLIDVKAQLSGMVEKEKVQSEELEQMREVVLAYQVKCDGLNRDVEQQSSVRKVAEQQAHANQERFKSQVENAVTETVEYQRQVVTLSREVERMQSELEAMQEALELKDAALEKMEGEVERVSNEMAQLMQAYDELQEQHEQELQAESMKTIETQAVADERIAVLLQELRESEEQVVIHANRSKELYEVNTELQNTLEELGERCERIERERNSLVDEKGALVGQLEQMEVNQQSMEEARLEHDSYMQQSMEEARVQYDSHIEQSNAEMKRIRAEADRQIAQVDAEKRKLEQRHAKLQGEYAAIIEENSQLASEKEQLRNENSVLAEKQESLREQHSVLVGEKDELHHKNNELAAKREQLADEYARIAGLNAMLESQKSLLEKENAFLVEQSSILANDKDARISDMLLSMNMLESKVQQQQQAQVEEDKRMQQSLNEARLESELASMREQMSILQEKNQELTLQASMPAAQMVVQQLIQKQQLLSQPTTPKSSRIKQKQQQSDEQQELGIDDFPMNQSDASQSLSQNNSHLSWQFQQQQQHDYASSRNVQRQPNEVNLLESDNEEAEAAAAADEAAFVDEEQFSQEGEEFNDFSYNKNQQQSRQQQEYQQRKSPSQNSSRPHSAVGSSKDIKDQRLLQIQNRLSQPTAKGAVASSQQENLLNGLVINDSAELISSLYEQLNHAQQQEIESQNLLSAAEERVEALQVEFAAAKEQIEHLHALHSSKQSEFDAAKEELQGQLAASQENSKKTINELERLLEDTKSAQDEQNEHMLSQITELEKQVRARESVVSNLQAQISSLEEHKSLIEQQLDQTNAEIEQRGQSFDAQVEGIQEQYERELESLRAELHNKSNEVQQIQQELNDELQSARQTISEYTECVASLQRDLTNKCESIETSRDDFKLVELAQQDLSIKLEVAEMKTKSYFNMLMKILLAFDADLDEKVSPATHSFEQLLTIGIGLAKNSLKQQQQQQFMSTNSDNHNDTSHAIYAVILEQLLTQVLLQRRNRNDGQRTVNEMNVSEAAGLSEYHREKVQEFVEQVNAYCVADV